MSFQRTTCPSFNSDRPTCLCRRLSRLFWTTVQVFAMTNSTIERPSETRRAQAERGREIARVDDLLYFSLLLYSVGCSSHLEIPVYLPIESIWSNLWIGSFQWWMGRVLLLRAHTHTSLNHFPLLHYWPIYTFYSSLLLYILNTGYAFACGSCRCRICGSHWAGHGLLLARCGTKSLRKGASVSLHIFFNRWSFFTFSSFLHLFCLWG